MADIKSSKNNGMMYFLAGGLIVGLIAFGAVYFAEHSAADQPDLLISVDRNGVEIEGH